MESPEQKSTNIKNTVTATAIFWKFPNKGWFSHFSTGFRENKSIYNPESTVQWMLDISTISWGETAVEIAHSESMPGNEARLLRRFGLDENEHAMSLTRLIFIGMENRRCYYYELVLINL